MKKTILTLIISLLILSGCGNEAPALTDNESDNVYKQDGTQYFKPITSAGVDQAVRVGTSVTLDGSGSTDSDGTIMSYEWKEGSTVLSNNVSFTKSDYSIGTHTITLTVTDNDGLKTSDTVIVIIYATPTHKANLSVVYNSDSKIATIDWNENSYKDSEGYIVQKSENSSRSIKSSWVEIARFSSGSGSYSLQDYTLVPSSYRIMAISDASFLSGDNATTELFVNPLQKSSIYFTQNDRNVTAPFNRVVTVNTLVDERTNIQKVIYYLDTKKIGESSKKPNFPLSINTGSYTNGNHRLDNELKIDDSSYITFYTPITTYNTNLNLSLRLGATTGVIPIIATASSKESINGVQFYLDSILVADIKEKNYCSNTRFGCGDSNNSYMWEWNSTSYTPKTYTIKTEVSDAGGEFLSKEITHVLNNPPVITLDSPLNESVVGNTLTISGSVTDDQESTTITIKVGDQTIYSANTKSFNTTYDMRGLVEKNYTLQVIATDASNKSTKVTRTVLYKADSNLTPWRTLGKDSSVVQLSSGYLVYKESNSLVRLNLTTESESRYDLGTIHYGSYYGIASSGAFAFYGTELTFDSTIFLAESTLSKIGTGQHPVVYKNNLLWINSYYSSLYLYDLGTKSVIDIKKPTDANYWLNWSYFLSDTNFCASANISSTPSNYAVYIYNIVTQATTRVTNSTDIVEMCQGIDESRIVFAEYNSTPNKLYYANLNNLSTPIKLSNNLSGSAKLSDGLMAWVDGDDKYLYALSSGETTPIQVAKDVQLREVKYGVLTYVKDSKIYLYKDGISKEIWPSSDTHYIDGDYIYILRGSEKLVYRVTSTL